MGVCHIHSIFWELSFKITTARGEGCLGFHRDGWIMPTITYCYSFSLLSGSSFSSFPGLIACLPSRWNKRKNTYTSTWREKLWEEQRGEIWVARHNWWLNDHQRTDGFFRHCNRFPVLWNLFLMCVFPIRQTAYLVWVGERKIRVDHQSQEWIAAILQRITTQRHGFKRWEEFK